MNNSNVNGKWIIPGESLPNIIQSAPKVLGLSLVGEQLWEYDGTNLCNTNMNFSLSAINWTFPSEGVAGVIRNENDNKVLEVQGGKLELTQKQTECKSD